MALAASGSKGTSAARSGDCVGSSTVLAQAHAGAGPTAQLSQPSVVRRRPPLGLRAPTTQTEDFLSPPPRPSPRAHGVSAWSTSPPQRPLPHLLEEGGGERQLNLNFTTPFLTFPRFVNTFNCILFPRSIQSPAGLLGRARRSRCRRPRRCKLCGTARSLCTRLISTPMARSTPAVLTRRSRRGR